MATISENLQIIADSTAAIKQAIIDKGGTIEGDITTWANAIGRLSGGGSEGENVEEIIFTGDFIEEPGGVNINGVISQTFDSVKRVIALTQGDNGTIVNSVVLFSGNEISLGLTTNSPISINPSDITMVLTDAGGGNGKIIKINS